MESSKLTNQVIDFQKQLWDNWNITLNVVEKQANSAVHWAMDHAYWMSNENRKTVEKYWTTCLDERVRLKNYVDEGYKILKKSFSETEAPVKTKSQAAATKS